MTLLAQTIAIARIELGFFVRFRALALATMVVALIPAIYVVIYLSSVWDPTTKTGALAVGLVNLDQGVVYREHAFNVGKDLISELSADHKFGYQQLADEQHARQLVRQGKLAFALIVPHDFSSNAIPGAAPGAGKLVVYASAGNNYESAAIARQFADALGQAVNDNLNEQRWALVLSSAAGSQQSVERLRQGVARLQTGARELAKGAAKASTGAKALSAGAHQLDAGVEKLTDGVRQLGGGLRTMEAQLPPAADVRRLRIGAETLADGHRELGQGLLALKTGSQQLKEGVLAFRVETNDSLLIPARVTQGLDQVGGGVNQLDNGLLTALQAQQKLAEGAAQLSGGVGALTSGTRTLRGALHTINSKLPEDRQLDQLAAGAHEVAKGTAGLSDGTRMVGNGSQELAAGIELLAASLPNTVETIEGSARGLANSVQPMVEIDAEVANHGSGFAPNVIPGALWLGAGIAAFLIHVRVLPTQARSFSQPAQLLGKAAVPAAVAMLQAGLVLLTVRYLLKIHIVNIAALTLVLAISSLTFLFIVFLLTRAFGDAGKALAMIFLALQLSSSGGVLPVELSGSLFEAISPWLPLTWVVKAIKASMFGAFENAWGYSLLLTSAAGLAAAGLACRVGHWRFVDPDTIRPAVSF